ncbi:hypothetical protein GGH97_002445 [Coemansia sp. RSA 475]|nr:hypothetical protein GGH97_002445 [Coemansia sp. RSA 475]
MRFNCARSRSADASCSRMFCAMRDAVGMLTWCTAGRCFLPVSSANCTASGSSSAERPIRFIGMPTSNAPVRSVRRASVDSSIILLNSRSRVSSSSRSNSASRASICRRASAISASASCSAISGLISPVSASSLLTSPGSGVVPFSVSSAI